jgi:glycosyltransferase involved in cell wall biosynthesis
VRPKVSVSVITYNHAGYIRSCLDSVLSQETDFVFEVIVGDDCSTDGTTEVIKEYGEKYQHILYPVFHRENVGGKMNFIDVYAKCCGEYVAYIDGDDIMLPGKLQRQADFLDRHPECAIVCHNLRIFSDETGETLYYANDRYKKTVSTIDDLIMHGTFFGHSSKMHRISSLPIDDIDRKELYAGDWLLHILSARSGKIGYIDEVLGEWRKQANSMSHNNSRNKLLVLDDMQFTIQKTASFASNKHVLRYAHTRLYCIYAFTHLRQGNMKKCFSYVLKIAKNRTLAPVFYDLLYYRSHLIFALDVMQRLMRKFRRAKVTRCR